MNSRDIPPPGLAEKFIKWFIKDELAEEVLGDLDEKFFSSLKSKTTIRAKLNYWYQVLNYIRPFAIKNYRSNLINNNMHLHNFKISLRSIKKNKVYSTINVVGLTIGLSVAILTGLWVNDELSFNKSFENYDKLAKIMVQYYSPQEDIGTGSVMPPGLGTSLRDNFSNLFEKVAIARSRPEEIILSNGRDQFTSTGLFIQKDALTMFNLELIEGSIDGTKDKNSILLSAPLAEKLFGDNEVVGQPVKYNGSRELTVTGIYKNLPTNSSFTEMEFLAPFELYIDGWSEVTVWDNYYTEVFVQLADNVSVEQANEQIEELLLPHIQGPAKRLLFVEPMANWHLYSDFENGVRITSQRMKFVWIFSAIGLFVLVLACINFINLSTARSEKRAKEIGIRKSIGSHKIQLIHQFLTEALLLSYISLFASVVIIYAIMPLFNQIAGKELILPHENPFFWLLAIGIASFTGLLAGSYPAFYLSSISPIKSLKGTYKVGNAVLPRQLLVIFQFSISIILIVGTLVIYSQIDHVKSRPVGYNQQKLLMLTKRTSDMYGKYDVFKSEFIKSGAVTAMGEASYPLDNTLGNNGGFGWDGKDPEFDPVFNTILVNYDYGESIGWEIIEGRDFSRDFTGDIRNAVVITESAKEIMGFDEAVGEEITFNNDYYSEPRVTIVGVVKDMIKGNPFEDPKPAIMFLSDRHLYWMFLRLNDRLSISESVTEVEKIIDEIAPDAPLDYKFVDDVYDAKFRSEERIGTLATFFAVLAVIISCLGLFGLASYVAEKRTKEIGIRKILGANVLQLWQKLSNEFIMLVIISTAVASPLAYYLLDSWLVGFEYRINLSYKFFILSGFLAMIVTLVTISYRTLKAALSNPVDAIRSE